MTVIKTFHVCLRGFSSYSTFFHIYENVTITGVELKTLTYAWHSLPLRSQGSLACRTYLVKGIRLKWSFPRTIDTHTERLSVELSYFLSLQFASTGIWTPNLPHTKANSPNRLHHSRSHCKLNKKEKEKLPKNCLIRDLLSRILPKFVKWIYHFITLICKLCKGSSKHNEHVLNRVQEPVNSLIRVIESYKKQGTEKNSMHRFVLS